MVRYMVEKIKDLYQLQQIFFEGGQIAKLVNIIYIIGRNKKEPRPADRPDVLSTDTKVCTKSTQMCYHRPALTDYTQIILLESFQHPHV